MTPVLPTMSVPICPLCQTMAREPEGEGFAAGDWRCRTCGQTWTARRLDTVAGYAVWVGSHPLR
jgi:hypothetical protein